VSAGIGSLYRSLITCTSKKLAAILAVSKIGIYKLAKADRIPSFRVGTCVRFDPRAVANWLRGQ
jgi:excisionase family DNA binding protein